MAIEIAQFSMLNEWPTNPRSPFRVHLVQKLVLIREIRVSFPRIPQFQNPHPVFAV
jgi:hypothetical protein